jgi:hypothetical protein
MTIKASYNTVGEKVFNFDTSLYSNGNYSKSVNNSEYKKIDTNLASFDSNEITIFEGNDGGFYLTVMHENEPVEVISSFISMEDLNSFLEIERSHCQTFNYTLSKDDAFFSYYLLKQQRNYSNPMSPHLHLLVKQVKSMEHFNALFSCYESLYEKREGYNQIVNKKKYREFSTDEFYGMLTEAEMNLLKFSLFCNSSDSFLCDSWEKSFLRSIGNLKDGAFEAFGIQDSTIDLIFQNLKMHPYYFIFSIRDKEESPSVFYFDRGEVNSFLKPEDELILWRSGKKFCEYLANNYEYTVDINEPDDQG